MQIAHGWGLSELMGSRETEARQNTRIRTLYNILRALYGDRDAKVAEVGCVEETRKSDGLSHAMSTSSRGRLQKVELKNCVGSKEIALGIAGTALGVVLEMMAPFAVWGAGELLYVRGSEKMGI